MLTVVVLASLDAEPELHEAPAGPKADRSI
jgi:hypothetical protein